MILLDTSYLVALFNRSDSQHARAKRLQAELAGESLIVLEYVVLELATVLAAKGGIDIAKEGVESLLQSEQVEFLPCSQLFSMALYRMFNQKTYQLSFVDSALLTCLEAKHAEKIVTFDEVLAKQAGASAFVG